MRPCTWMLYDGSETVGSASGLKTNAESLHAWAGPLDGMDFDVGTGKEVRESELPALEQLVAMGYEYKSQRELNRTREKLSEVLLYDRLEAGIRRLNPQLDDSGVRDAVRQICEGAYPRNLDPVGTNEKIRAKLIGLSQTGGLEPIAVQDGARPVHRVVRLFDFENAENNDFVVTNQFRVQRRRNPILPDVVVFANGIPLVLIECKDPTIPEPLRQAYENNLSRYQSPGSGCERLFFYNHCMIATCGMLARVGTLQSDINNYARWAEPYPFSAEEVKMMNGRYREQEILIAGLLSKQNLLSHLKNFVIYQTVNNKKVKKVARHQQFRAVTKSASRIRNAGEIQDKGGVIWHTQGSGKSLSMLWLASRLMYESGNPPIVIATDRRQLDRQIHETFQSCGFPAPIRARSGKHLKELLANARGKTIMTVIDKFSTYEDIHTSEKVVCLVDEAHRSQFRENAERMRAAMPNAVFFGFSGTPIDREDRSTYRVFGPMLDKYGFKESQEDGATVPIRYTERLPNLFVEGDTLEQVYERVIGQDPSIDADLKERLKSKYVTKENIAEAPSRIKKIAKDIIEHYANHIMQDGYKAMVVAPSRKVAVMYKREFDTLDAPPSKIIMTSEIGEEGGDWDEYFLNPDQRERESEKFKNSDDPTKILIVVDMLLVGYDVPICQVLYLDHALKEHHLLQAIARVNRPYDEAKAHGLIVDYSGVTRELQSALEAFDDADVEGAMEPLDGMLEELRAHHINTMSYFDGVDREDYDGIIEKFESKYMRHRFEQDFRMFARTLNAILPDTRAGPYLKDFKFAGEARQLLRTRYDGVKPSTKSYGLKIQRLIDDHIRALGITSLVDPMELEAENLLASLKGSSDRAKSAVIRERAILIIEELGPHNPAFYEGLSERLQRLIDEEEERRKTNAGYFTRPNLFQSIYEEALSEEKEQKRVFGDYDANSFEFALYGELCKKKNREDSIDITKRIYKGIRSETELVDWKNKSSVEKNIKATAYEILREVIADGEIGRILDVIFDLARDHL